MSKELLSTVDVEVGDEVDVVSQDGLIVITPRSKMRGGHDLKDLVKRIPKDYQPFEVDWGEPSGKEVW